MSYGDLPVGAPHKPNKGKEGGACNRERCQAEPALWYNHGSHAWYCEDCAIAIGLDHVNHRDWLREWQPRLGHPQFETREMMDRGRPQCPPLSDTDVRELVERDIAFLRLPGHGPSSPYRAIADHLESLLSRIAKLEERVRELGTFTSR